MLRWRLASPNGSVGLGAVIDWICAPSHSPHAFDRVWDESSRSLAASVPAVPVRVVAIVAVVMSLAHNRERFVRAFPLVARSTVDVEENGVRVVGAVRSIAGRRRGIRPPFILFSRSTVLRDRVTAHVDVIAERVLREDVKRLTGRK